MDKDTKEYFDLKFDPLVKQVNKIDAELSVGIKQIDANIETLKDKHNANNIEIKTIQERLKQGAEKLDDYEKSISDNSTKIAEVEKKTDSHGFKLGLLWSGLGIVSAAIIVSVVGFIIKIVPALMELTVLISKLKSTIP